MDGFIGGSAPLWVIGRGAEEGGFWGRVKPDRFCPLIEWSSFARCIYGFGSSYLSEFGRQNETGTVDRDVEEGVVIQSVGRSARVYVVEGCLARSL